jgi:phage-related protein (TIGR01555 family)
MGFIEQLERALERVDGWANLVTGVGTDRRSKRLAFSPDAILPEELLEQLYVGDPYANRICRVVPEEALRQGAKITTGDAGADTAVAEHFDAFEVNARLTRAWTWSRVFGGGAVLVGADDGRPPWEPLDETAIRTVAFLDVVDARELRPDRYETNPRAMLFCEPLTYRLSRTGGGASESAVWHRSRLILFDGAPTTRRRRQLLHGWGESELQRLYGILAHFNGGWEATGTLLQQASEGVFTLKGLMGLMAADKRDVLKRRLEMMDLARGVTRSVLLDEGESYTRTEVGALTGVADLLTKNLLLLSGAAEIPVTVLMGQAPAGLSATGESDVRWFYDRTRSAQEQVLLSRHRRLVRILLAAKDGPTAGQIPARLAITYPPLWQPTPLEAADLRVKQSQVDNVYITAQVVTAEEVAASRFGTGTWSAETTIDLGDREAVQGAEDEANREVNADTEAASAIVAKVAGRELPRDGGVALLVASGMDPATADRVMGEAGRTFFTAPEPGHAAAMDTMKADLAKAQASLRGHQAYTARLIQRAKDGGLELGAFTAREPTEVAEGDELAPGDVVAVPVDAAVPPAEG